MLLIAVVCLSENLLDVDKGVFFYAFFFTFFIFSHEDMRGNTVRSLKSEVISDKVAGDLRLEVLAFFER
jgi:hypothetical protein